MLLTSEESSKASKNVIFPLISVVFSDFLLKYKFHLKMWSLVDRQGYTAVYKILYSPCNTIKLIIYEVIVQLLNNITALHIKN